MRPYAKYRNRRTEVDGVTFASKREARRYQELALMQKAGVISGLELQPRYPLVVNGVKVGTYVADFRYRESPENGFLLLVVEDAKGVRTPVFRLKAKLMKALHGIEIREV